MSVQKEIGRVKRFNHHKGYGFIEMRDDGRDAFVHHSEIQMDGYRFLRPGDYVLLNVTETPKGLYAKGVHPLTPDEAFRVLEA